jgi:hypothetical protein
MEEFHITSLLKIIYLAKRNNAFCENAENYVVKAMVTFWDRWK